MTPQLALRVIFLSASMALAAPSTESMPSVIEQMTVILGTHGSEADRQNVLLSIDKREKLPTPQDFKMMIDATSRVMNESEMAELFLAKHGPILSADPIDYTLLVGLFTTVLGRDTTKRALRKAPSSFQGVTEFRLRTIRHDYAKTDESRAVIEKLMGTRPNVTNPIFKIFRDKVALDRLPPGDDYFRKELNLESGLADGAELRSQIKARLESLDAEKCSRLLDFMRTLDNAT